MYRRSTHRRTCYIIAVYKNEEMVYFRYADSCKDGASWAKEISLGDALLDVILHKQQVEFWHGRECTDNIWKKHYKDGKLILTEKRDIHSSCPLLFGKGEFIKKK